MLPRGTVGFLAIDHYDLDDAKSGHIDIGLLDVPRRNVVEGDQSAVERDHEIWICQKARADDLARGVRVHGCAFGGGRRYLRAVSRYFIARADHRHVERLGNTATNLVNGFGAIAPSGTL